LVLDALKHLRVALVGVEHRQLCAVHLVEQALQRAHHLRA
jgi:hypothetical protein